MSKRQLSLLATLTGLTLGILGLVWLFGPSNERARPERRAPGTAGDPAARSMSDLLDPGHVAESAEEGVPTASTSSASAEAPARVPGITPSRSIAGRLLWPDGKPAQNGFVHLYPLGLRMETWTDAEGRFEFRPVEETQAVRLKAGWVGGPFDTETGAFTPWKGWEESVEWTATLDDVPPGAHDLELVLGRGTLSGDGGALRGRVLDESGLAHERFVVAISSGILVRQDSVGTYLGKADVVRAFQDAAGEFLLEGLEPGSYTALAFSRGCSLSDPVEVEVPSGRAVDLIVPRGGRIEGVVLDALGRAVPGVIWVQEVPSIGAFDNANWPEEGIPTEANGTFSIPVILGKSYFYATSDLGSPSEVVSDPVASRAIVENLELRLAPSTSLIVDVLDEEGRPEPGVEVCVHRYSTYGYWRSETTDPAGQATFANVPVGRLDVEEGTVRYDEDERLPSRTAMVDLAPGETRHVVLRSDEKIRLSGQVRVGGEPLIAGELWITGDGGFSETARTNEDGRYSQRLASPGVYEVSIEVPGGLRHSSQVEVHPGTDCAFDIDVVVGRIAGHVFRPDGKPFEGAMVQARSSGRPRRWFESSVKTDGEGAFEMSVQPGTYVVLAGPPDPEEDLQSTLAPSSREGVVVDANTIRMGIDFQLAEGGAIEGRVFHEDGSPATEAVVTASDGVTSCITLSGLNGRFRLEGVRPGPTEVLAVDIDSDGKSYKLALGSTDVIAGKAAGPVELVLGPGCLLSVHVQVPLGASTRPEVTLDGLFVVSGEARYDESSGTHAFDPLPPGAYTVCATLDGREVSAAFELSRAESKTIELRFE